MKNITLILFLITQLNTFGQGKVNCSLLQVTDVIINNSNLSMEFGIYNGDTMDSHYPFIAFTIDNSGDTIQHGDINWFVTPALDTSWYNYNLLGPISPSFPLNIYFVYSNLTGSNPGSDTCILNYTQTITSHIKIDNRTVKLFPNPSDNYITFNLKHQTHGQIILTDILGKEVLIENYNSKQVLLDLNRLKSKGTYFAKILDFDGNIIALKKLVYQ
ncbi:MAG: T9SS type A sorting domain-containing protein [Flavobacteriales bacterium]|nr:T9SS type A sorting domain-containing protein [Flavobacteriales bacterium]